MSFDPKAIFQLSSHIFGTVAVEVSEVLAVLLELSKQLGSSACGRAVDEVEDCHASVSWHEMA